MLQFNPELGGSSNMRKKFFTYALALNTNTFYMAGSSQAMESEVVKTSHKNTEQLIYKTNLFINRLLDALTFQNLDLSKFVRHINDNVQKTPIVKLLNEVEKNLGITSSLKPGHQQMFEVMMYSAYINIEMMKGDYLGPIQNHYYITVNPQIAAHQNTNKTIFGSKDIDAMNFLFKINEKNDKSIIQNTNLYAFLIQLHSVFSVIGDIPSLAQGKTKEEIKSLVNSFKTGTNEYKMNNIINTIKDYAHEEINLFGKTNKCGDVEIGQAKEKLDQILEERVQKFNSVVVKIEKHF